MKACTKCHRALPLEAFGRSSKKYGDGYNTRCKDCRNAYIRERQRTDLSRARRRSVFLKSAYGITLADYRTMLATQDGRCAVCRSLPGEEQQKALVVDHDHETGEVRGILCNACNTGLGSFRDDPSRLVAAAIYLYQHGTEPMPELVGPSLGELFLQRFGY